MKMMADMKHCQRGICRGWILVSGQRNESADQILFKVAWQIKVQGELHEA